jgi:hypothetical protein
MKREPGSAKLERCWFPGTGVSVKDLMAADAEALATENDAVEGDANEDVVAATALARRRYAIDEDRSMIALQLCALGMEGMRKEKER